jgi:glucose/arabinose dehydrogenase
MNRLLPYCLLLCLACTSTSPEDTSVTAPASPTPTLPVNLAPKELTTPRQAGIKVPQGFTATLFADALGKARHIAAAPDGSTFINLKNLKGGKGLVQLRDADGNGEAENTTYFSNIAGTGIEVYNGYIYASDDVTIYRIPLNNLNATPEVVVSGFPEQRQHAAKSFAIAADGTLYVNIGGPSNACQQKMRSPGSPGLDPCSQLEQHAGIWKFNANQLNQQASSGSRYATGIRNAMALAVHPQSQQLYAVQHGRDQLAGLWPAIFTEGESAELPSEELFLVTEGADFGWPYCYYNHLKGQKLLAPEYGGNGSEQARCADKDQPIFAFPGHMAPNDMLFYNGSQFPDRYKEGVFIAFHGSWNRTPFEQEGFFVAFVPFEGNKPAASAEWEIFAGGFEGPNPVNSPSEATYRPTGLTQSPDGAILITDSVNGRTWRISYPNA